MKTINISLKEEHAVKYAMEFLHNAFTEHKNDTIGKQVKPELKALISLNKKLKSVEPDQK